MKKAVAYLTAIITGAFALQIPIDSFAEEINQDSKEKSAEINVNYNMGSSYEITIPASVTFTDSETTVERALQARNVRIDADKALNVMVSSENGFKMVNHDASMDYHIIINYASTPEGNQFNILKVKAGESSGWAILQFVTELSKGEALYAGNYTDTLTFQVSVDG